MLYITAQTMAYTTHIITLCMLPFHSDHPHLFILHSFHPPDELKILPSLSQPPYVCSK